MLKTTPSLTPTIDPKTTEDANSKPLCKVGFYADCPDGTTNKKFTYLIHNFDHALNLLDRFKEKGFKIRVAFFTNEVGLNNRIPY